MLRELQHGSSSRWAFVNPESPKPPLYFPQSRESKAMLLTAKEPAHCPKEAAAQRRFGDFILAALILSGLRKWPERLLNPKSSSIKPGPRSETRPRCFGEITICTCISLTSPLPRLTSSKAGQALPRASGYRSFLQQCVGIQRKLRRPQTSLNRRLAEPATKDCFRQVPDMKSSPKQAARKNQRSADRLTSVR